jgi:GGDEF domain-containing protein
MLKRHALLAALCAALCATPLLTLLWPTLAYPFASTPAGLDNWRLGLELGLAVLAALAWRLNQNRLVAVAVGLAASAAFTTSSQAAGPLETADAWLVAVPSGLALCLLPREGALVSGRTFARLALLFLPAALFWAVATSNPQECAHWLRWTPWPEGPSPRQPSLAAHASLLLFALVLAWRPPARIESALEALGGGLAGMTVLAWGLALAAPDPTLLRKLWLAGHLAQAAGLALGLFLLYWQRVYLDELTGIPNRRALDERLGHLDKSFSLAMVDIDHFKNFNDTYGHAQGDDVLRMVAVHLRESTGARAYRYGGEEFCVLAGDLDTGALESLMDGARSSLAARRFHIRPPSPRPQAKPSRGRGPLAPPSVSVQVTVSVGVAGLDRSRDTPGKVMKLADEGLYEAKASGRNLVVKKN